MTSKEVRINQLLYEDIITEVKQLMEEMALTLQTEVFVFSYKPLGWKAVVGSRGLFYVFTKFGKRLYMHKEIPKGFKPNGFPIL